MAVVAAERTQERGKPQPVSPVVEHKNVVSYNGITMKWKSIAGQPELHLVPDFFATQKNVALKDEVAMVRYARGGNRLDAVFLGGVFEKLDGSKRSPVVIVAPSWYNSALISHDGFGARLSTAPTENEGYILTSKHEAGSVLIQNENGIDSLVFWNVERESNGDEHKGTLTITQSRQEGSTWRDKVLVVPLSIGIDKVTKEAPAPWLTYK